MLPGIKVICNRKATSRKKFEATLGEPVGMCPVGRGSTWKEAVGDLVVNSLKEMNLPPAIEGGVTVFYEDGTPFKFWSYARQGR